MTLGIKSFDLMKCSKISGEAKLLKESCNNKCDMECPYDTEIKSDSRVSIKAAFFDYDFTLCVHPSYITESGFQSVDIVYNEGKGAYKDCIAPQKMKDFVAVLRDNGVCTVCISCTNFLKMEGKLGWVEQHYGDSFNHKLYIAKDYEDKINICSTLASSIGFCTSECLFIDDIPEVRKMAYRAGFIVVSPQEILCSDKIFDIETYPWAYKDKV